MKKKPTIIVFIVLALCALIIGVNHYIKYLHYEKIEVSYTYVLSGLEHPSPEYANETSEGMFYLDVIRNSTGAVVGEYISVKEEGENYVFSFKNVRVVYGDIKEEIIEYCSKKKDEKTNCFYPDRFEAGQRYLLFLMKNDGAILDYPRYISYGNAYIPFDRLTAADYKHGKIRFPEGATENSIVKHYKNLAEERGFNINSDGSEYYYPKIIRNESLENVMKEADVVARISVESYKRPSTARYVPSYSYKVRIKEALKGEEAVKEGADVLHTVYALGDSFEAGKEYIVALSPVSNVSKNGMFELTARNGIVSSEDTETTDKIYKWLEN